MDLTKTDICIMNNVKNIIADSYSFHNLQYKNIIITTKLFYLLRFIMSFFSIILFYHPLQNASARSSTAGF